MLARELGSIVAGSGVAGPDGSSAAAAAAAHLLVVLPDPQPHRLQLRHRVRVLPELGGRTAVLLAGHSGPAAGRPAAAAAARSSS